MENLHRTFIIEKFPQANISNKLIVLGIPDFYYYMEPELIDLLKARIDPSLAPQSLHHLTPPGVPRC